MNFRSFPSAMLLVPMMIGATAELNAQGRPSNVPCVPGSNAQCTVTLSLDGPTAPAPPAAAPSHPQLSQGNTCAEGDGFCDDASGTAQSAATASPTTGRPTSVPCTPQLRAQGAQCTEPLTLALPAQPEVAVSPRILSGAQTCTPELQAQGVLCTLPAASSPPTPAAPSPTGYAIYDSAGAYVDELVLVSERPDFAELRFSGMNAIVFVTPPAYQGAPMAGMIGMLDPNTPACPGGPRIGAYGAQYPAWADARISFSPDQTDIRLEIVGCGHSQPEIFTGSLPKG